MTGSTRLAYAQSIGAPSEEYSVEYCSGAWWNGRICKNSTILIFFYEITKIPLTGGRVFSSQG